MTPDQLENAGVRLYGRHWQTDLAEALGINPRHMRRLAKGERNITNGMAADIANIARQRSLDLQSLADELAGKET